MPDIIQRTANGINIIPLDTFNCDRRTLCIKGEITQEAAFGFALAAAYLNDLSQAEPITVYINSPGGSIDAGLLMYDVIQTSPAPIRLVVMGAAYSMAALLFASGLHGRYLLPNSKLMLHEPLLGCSIGGNTSSIKTISDDFATGGQIPNFQQHISIFREKGIAAMMLVQSLAQLESMYGPAASVTIQDNTDNIVYMGGNNLDTAEQMARRINKPMDEVLALPRGQIYLFRSGQKALQLQRYRIFNDPLYQQKIAPLEAANAR